MVATETVIDHARVGRKGFPIHYAALGLDPPMKTVPVEARELQTTHPDLDATEIYRHEIQALIDAKAREKQYDSGATLASYVNSTMPEWAAEAHAFITWRDQVWAYALAELVKGQSGKRKLPKVDDFIAEVPSFEWAAAFAGNDF